MADTFLKVSHITQTRDPHYVTAFPLSVLQRDTFEVASENVNENSFEEWRQCMINSSAFFGILF